METASFLPPPLQGGGHSLTVWPGVVEQASLALCLLGGILTV